MESGNDRSCDGVDEITPKLALSGAGESTIPQRQFLSYIKTYLTQQ